MWCSTICSWKEETIMVEPEEDSSLKLEVGKIQSLIKSLGDSGMGNLLGGNNAGSDGLGGGVLLGLLLGRSGILGGNGLDGAAAVTAANGLTAADVQNIVSANTNSQTLGNLEGEIWKAEGQLQGQLLAQSNTQQITTLNAEIANLQGQSGILASLNNVAKDVINEVHETGDVVSDAISTLSAATAAGFGVVNTNIAQSTYATSLAINNDGEKTRASIAALAASIPNSRELDLQRQLAVALDDHRHSTTRGVVDSGNVNVVTNVNQTAVAQAQATANQQIIGLLGTVASAIQHNTQSTVNLGTMIGSGQTATNVKS